jgi:hypothetical protein
MLARRALRAHKPSLGTISCAATLRSLNTALGSDRIPSHTDGEDSNSAKYSDPTDRANANAYARTNKAAGMLAGISFAALTSAYVVMCNTGDDTGSSDFGARVAKADSKPNYKAGAGAHFNRESRETKLRSPSKENEAMPFSNKAVDDQPRREKNDQRTGRDVDNSERTNGGYNRYVVDAPTKDPRLSSDAPRVKSDPLIVDRAKAQLDGKVEEEMQPAKGPSMLDRLKKVLWVRATPSQHRLEDPSDETESRFGEKQMRDMNTHDVATADAGSLFRSRGVLPQRAMADEKAPGSWAEDGNGNNKDEEGDFNDNSENTLARAVGTAKGRFYNVLHEAKDYLTHRSRGDDASAGFGDDGDDNRQYYTRSLPPISDESPKRYEHDGTPIGLKDEYEEKKNEARKRYEEDIDKAAKFNDLEALAGHGHYRIHTKVTSEPFTAKPAAEEQLDRDARIFALENWSILQGKQVAEQGRRWRARTANQSGVQETAVTGHEPLRWFTTSFPNEADIKADRYAPNSHGSLERRRGIAENDGASDDAPEKITGTGTHGDAEAGDTGTDADVQKQSADQRAKERRYQNDSASEPARPTSVRPDEPMTTKQLGAQEDRETLDMRG